MASIETTVCLVSSSRQTREYFHALAQTLRTALGSIDKHRQSLVSHHLQHAPVTDTSSSTNNHTDNRTRMRVALAKASITTSFYDSHECDDGAGGAGATPGGIGAAADMAFHELAALQLVSAIGWCCCFLPSYTENKFATV